MAIKCQNCGAEFDVTLFTFDRKIQCDCGAWVDMSVGHQQMNEHADQEANMAKRKSKSAIEGRWNIVSMTEWDEQFLHEEVQAFIEFHPKGTGEFQFAYVRGQMDCRATEKDGKPSVEFTWVGFDEMDPESGYGWAVYESGSLTGMLAFDDGDESGFTAENAE